MPKTDIKQIIEILKLKFSTDGDSITCNVVRAHGLEDKVLISIVEEWLSHFKEKVNGKTN